MTNASVRQFKKKKTKRKKQCHTSQEDTKIELKEPPFSTFTQQNNKECCPISIIG